MPFDLGQSLNLLSSILTIILTCPNNNTLLCYNNEPFLTVQQLKTWAVATVVKCKKSQTLRWLPAAAVFIQEVLLPLSLVYYLVLVGVEVEQVIVPPSISPVGGEGGSLFSALVN